MCWERDRTGDISAWLATNCKEWEVALMCDCSADVWLENTAIKTRSLPERELDYELWLWAMTMSYNYELSLRVRPGLRALFFQTHSLLLCSTCVCLISQFSLASVLLQLWNHFAIAIESLFLSFTKCKPDGRLEKKLLRPEGGRHSRKRKGRVQK